MAHDLATGARMATSILYDIYCMMLWIFRCGRAPSVPVNNL